MPVSGGTRAPPKNNRNQIKVATIQKVSMKGIGRAAAHAKQQFTKQIWRDTSDSYPPVIEVVIPP